MKSWWPYILGAALAIAALAGGVYWFGIEHVEKEVEVEASGEARRNPYLALERLLGHYGDEVETRWSQEGPGKASTLLFARGVPIATPDRVRTWTDWIESGGHLIAVAPVVDRDDPDRLSPDARFVRALGFRVRKPSEPLQPPRWRIYTAGEEKLPSSRPSIAWTSEQLDWMAESTAGPALAISRPRGRGRVTLLWSSQIVRNRHVGGGEYATLARDLLALGGQEAGRRVTIVRFLRRKSWWAYVWQHTWPAAIVLVLIVELALWQGRYRFGPMRAPRDDDPRRSRLEHVRASGRFLWRHGGADRLIEATRTALFEQIDARHPGFLEASPAHQQRVLVDAWGLSETEARQILEDPEVIDPEIFYDLVETMESHRRTT